MYFFTLFAATLATYTTSAVAAPSPCDCQNGGNPPGPVTSPGPAKNTTVRVGYTLDLHPETPLGSLSCSATFAKNFPNFKTLGQLPSSPFYGEVPGAVDGSPSSKCGTCWELQYNGQAPAYMIAVDNAAMIQLGGDAFKTFAGAAGVAQGSVEATAVQVDPKKCGLP